MSFGASQCMSLNDLKADFLDEESSLTLELRDFTVCERARSFPLRTIQPLSSPAA
jgi:hypothetical protein